jgi:acetyl-CoA carboxylase carboxyl transferase subunit beta
MDLRNLFSKISFDSKSKEQPTKKDAPSHWVKCPECNSLMFFKEVENQDNICPKCNFHMRIGAKRRIEILTDKDSFVEYDVDLKPNDPLKFVDKTSYKKILVEHHLLLVVKLK